MRSFGDFPCNEVGLIDKFIGSAYDNVRKVADNLSLIEELAQALTGFATKEYVTELLQNFVTVSQINQAVEDAFNEILPGVLNRDNHTGTQSMGTIVGLNETLDNKINISDLSSILSNLVFDLPDEADGDTIPPPGSGRLYLSAGVLKVA